MVAAVLALFLELSIGCRGFMESSYQIKAAFPFFPCCVGNRSRRLSGGQRLSRGCSTSQPAAKPPPLEHTPNRLHLPGVAFAVADNPVGGDLVGRCVVRIHGNGELLRVLHTRGSCGLSFAGGHEMHHAGDGEEAPIPCGLDDFAAPAATLFEAAMGATVDAVQCGGAILFCEALHLHRAPRSCDVQRMQAPSVSLADHGG